jgi:hypothetical protein
MDGVCWDGGGVGGNSGVGFLEEAGSRRKEAGFGRKEAGFRVQGSGGAISLVGMVWCGLGDWDVGFGMDAVFLVCVVADVYIQSSLAGVYRGYQCTDPSAEWTMHAY